MTHYTVAEPAGDPEFSAVPLVTVIVPHREGLEMIKACVESILESDYPSKEIIVIDNNSADGSAAYLENRYANKVHVLRSSVNLYYAAALNLGMRYAHGAYILFLNDDTKVSLTYLSRLVGFMESDSSVGAAQGLVMSYDPPFIPEHVSKYMDQFGYGIGTDPMRLDPSQRAHEIFSTAGAAMIVRRELLEEIGGFDDQLVLYWEEADLCWRIWLAGYKCMLFRNAMVYHRGKVTTSQVPEEFAAFHFWKNRLRILLKYHSATRLPTVLPVVILWDILAALNEVFKRKIHVAAATVRAVFWNLCHMRETLRARERVRLHVGKVPDSVVYALMRPNILLATRALRLLRGNPQVTTHACA